MKVTKSAIYRLQVATSCGCAASGEYEDEACKKAKGPITFTPCDKHGQAPGLDMVEMLLTEMVGSEAEKITVAPAIHPRSAALIAGNDEANQQTAAAVPARSLRTAGSTGEVRSPATPARPAPGSHRPTGGGPKGNSPFRRADTSSRLSPHAAAALGGSKVASRGGNAGIELGGELDFDLDAVPEDHRVTSLVEQSGFLDMGDDED